MSNRIAPKLLAEFIGTFAFVFIGGSAAAVVGNGVGLPGITAVAFVLPSWPLLLHTAPCRAGT